MLILGISKDFNKSDLDLSKMTQSQGFSISEDNPQVDPIGVMKYVVSSLGDINRDGFNDFSIIGQYSDFKTGGFFLHGNGNGYIVFGRDGTKEPFTDIKFTGTSKDWIKITGNYTLISGIGDIDSDGYSDIAINSYIRHVW